ncbi:DNA protecting protein DprA [Mycolicibacterium rhodesiae NBB3]|uniref:DNA protecting protein DprA n=1 Tax=Mycolicibacterium rhodesiae (strain NBB3) TaxID=710685 RepID=G8RN53_MYCRN|nr:DNA-processing protein DprA [Mycolicibacterium rhodesiae]AEV76247.1 DNA protecting protein DprA [Mycolicibacterium rhodesiae NBB3]
MTDQISRAWAYLSRVAEPPCPELRALTRRVGPVEAAERVRTGDVDDVIARRTEARRQIDCAANDLETLDRMGGRLINADDAEWPLLAFNSFCGVSGRPQAHEPMVLWVVGPAYLAGIAERAAAIVGTRAATAYGEFVAADLAAGLAARDAAVVSGGAFGIDGAAHRAALAADGVTVAVLAGGIDVPYPAAHAAMLRRVRGEGLVISEYPPGERPARHRFLTRNRLVAALAGATVVVEAGARSGAANTAAWAGALGRPVCAVPGPVTSSASVGCHALLRAGANVITRTEDLVELIGRAGELAPEEPRPASPLDELADAERHVYDALPARGSRTADEVAVAAGLPPMQVLGPLAVLELSGLVVRSEGRWKLARRT